MIALRIESPHDTGRYTVGVCGAPLNPDICRECDARVRRVNDAACSGQYKAVLWAILYACLSQPGHALEWRDIIPGFETRSEYSASMRVVITHGMAHAAGLYVDITGYLPSFMEPRKPEPRNPKPR